MSWYSILIISRCFECINKFHIKTHYFLNSRLGLFSCWVLDAMVPALIEKRSGFEFFDHHSDGICSVHPTQYKHHFFSPYSPYCHIPMWVFHIESFVASNPFINTRYMQSYHWTHLLWSTNISWLSFIDHHSSIWQEKYIKEQHWEIMALDFSTLPKPTGVLCGTRIHSHPFISQESKVGILAANFTGMGLLMKQL